jgi:hypothetical protein
METLRLVSAYAKMISPFLAAILSGWNTYDAREKSWRFISGIIVTLILLAIGCANVLAGRAT